MTETRLPMVGRRNERGSALLGVVLLLMLMSALAAALAVSGETETLISRNQRDGARAQAAAEAGLSHALELATTFIFEWKNNGFGSADAAIDSLLAGVDDDPADTADNGGLDERTGIVAGEDIPIGGPNVAIAGGINVQYTALVMDDDPTAPAAEPENADLADDLNRVLVVRATGFGPDNTRVTVEAMISSLPLSSHRDERRSLLGWELSGRGLVGRRTHEPGPDRLGQQSEQSRKWPRRLAPTPTPILISTAMGALRRVPIPPVNASDYLAASRLHPQV